MTRASLRNVPNQPKTPQRTVRVTDELWLAAKAKAEAEGQTVSDVVRQALENYLRATRADVYGFPVDRPRQP